MKRYIIISTVIHVLCFLLIAFKADHDQSQKQATGVETTTVELVEAQSGGESDQGKSGNDVQVIEMNPAGEGESKELNNFYWGVGISGEYLTLADNKRVYRITTVFGGYTADSAGLLPGDMIYSVNGGDVSTNEISGEGPMHLILGIIRGNNNIFINLDRTKVYY